MQVRIQLSSLCHFPVIKPSPSRLRDSNIRLYASQEQVTSDLSATVCAAHRQVSNILHALNIHS